MNAYELSAGYKGIDSFWKVVAFARDLIAGTTTTTTTTTATTATAIATCQSGVPEGLDCNKDTRMYAALKYHLSRLQWAIMNGRP